MVFLSGRLNKSIAFRPIVDHFCCNFFSA